MERAQPVAEAAAWTGKKDLNQIWMADTHEAANDAFDCFVQTYEDKYPKVVETLIKDRDELLAFYDCPAVHWQSLRTTNPIGSTFATIRHSTKRSKGCLSRTTKLSMMYKLGQCVERKWRRLRRFRELDKVMRGVKLKMRLNLKGVSIDISIHIMRLIG